MQNTRRKHTCKTHEENIHVKCFLRVLYMYVFSVCFTCMFSPCALHVCFLRVFYMYVFSVCFTCMFSPCVLHVCFLRMLLTCKTH
jgi:hypothetical protein